MTRPFIPPNNQVKIKPLEKNDQLPQLLYNLAEKSYASGSPWSVEQFEESVKGAYNQFWGAFLEEECVGFLSLIELADEAEIHHVAIKQQAQHRGIGRSLLKETVQILFSKGIEKVFLEVRESNGAARSLYEKVGFQEEGRRKNYYRNPIEDAVVMQLQKEAVGESNDE